MRNWELFYVLCNFYWSQKGRIAIKTMTMVTKDLLNKIIKEHRTNLVNYPYMMLLEV